MQIQIPAKPSLTPNADVRPSVIAGLAVVFGLLGGLLLWGGLTSISGAVIAQGAIAVESKIKTVQHMDGGIVAEIAVRDGNLVKAGDLLLRLDATDVRANLGITQANLGELYGQRSRLEAERLGGNSITFPRVLWEAVGDEAASKIVKGEAALYQARRDMRLGQERVLRQKVAQIKEEISGLEAQRDGKQRQADLLQKELKALVPLERQRLVPRPRIVALEREAATNQGELGKHIGDIARAKATIEETELQILQIERELQEKVAAEYKEVQRKIAELEERRLALNAKLKLIDIRAPIDGRVHNLSIFTIGGVVSPAREILQLVPDTDKLIVESRISPSDIAQVKMGQPAAIRIAAFESRTTPLLQGTVSLVSSAQFVDQASRAPYFTVNIEIPEPERLRLKPEQVLKPGMPTEVFIRTAERTVLDYLLRPLYEQIARAFRER